MEKVSNFSERFRLALGDESMTDFAKRIGMSKQAISTYATGRSHPKRPVIETLARVLNVNEAWLLGFDVSRERARQKNDGISLTEEEEEFLANYRKLNNIGKMRLSLYLDDLIDNPKFNEQKKKTTTQEIREYEAFRKGELEKEQKSYAARDGKNNIGEAQRLYDEALQKKRKEDEEH